MASVHSVAFLTVILVLQSWIATSDILAPMLSPIFDAVCKEVECGKGSCKPSNNSTLGFECECDAGWKQARFEHDDGLKFLPCVIPNCSLNMSCGKGSSPVVQNDTRAHLPITHPCRWVDCGGGTCTKTSFFTYSCECKEGYYNLINVTAFPCFQECELGLNCSQLGISISNKSASPTLSLPENVNKAISLRGGDWFVFTLILLGLVSWK